MAGKTKHAQRLATQIGVSIDAACAVTRVGAAAGGVAAGIGGAVGAAVGGVMATRGRKAVSDIQFPSVSWLALGDGRFWFVKGDLFLGKPKGSPFAEVSYADVVAVQLTDGRLATRVDLDLADGRYVAFESKKRGANKSNVEVLELLNARCGG